MRDFKNITLSPIQIITSFVLITAVAVAACWPSITGIEEDTDLRLFLLIYVLTAIFIYYWFVNIYKHWINLYLDVCIFTLVCW